MSGDGGLFAISGCAIRAWIATCCINSSRVSATTSNGHFAPVSAHTSLYAICVSSEVEVEPDLHARELVRFVDRPDAHVGQVLERTDDALSRDVVEARFRFEEREHLEAAADAEVM